MVALGLNHVSQPNMAWVDLVAFAQRVGCSGIELRNDLQRPLFDGDAADTVQHTMVERGMSLFAVAEIAGFNDLDAAGYADAAELVTAAGKAGARGVALIPKVGGSAVAMSRTVSALERLAPLLETEGLLGYVEPIGFPDSSLKTKAAALHAIAAAGGEHLFSLIHDTFHHHLAGETALFPARTAMVHVSWVSNPARPDRLSDTDRGLVDRADRLGTLHQLRELVKAGYDGPVSIEAFAPEVQRMSEAAAPFARCLEAIRKAIEFEIPEPAV